MGVHFYDCYEFLTEGLSDNVLVWQGYPYSVLWYAFFFVALQVKSSFWVVILICVYLAAAALDAIQMQELILNNIPFLIIKIIINLLFWHGSLYLHPMDL